MPEKTYGTVITSSGAALIAACILNGTKLPITDAAVGDGDGAYYQPTVDQMELKNKKWEGEIASATISTTTANMIDVKIIVPADVGGFIVREAAIYSDDGTMVAVCNTPDTEKVAIDEGVSGKLTLLMHLIVADTSVLQFVINPSLDTVSEDDLAAAIDAHNEDPEAHPDIIERIDAITHTISTVPTQSGSLTYTGSPQSPTWNGYNPDTLTLGGVTQGTDAGTYEATFTPKAGYTWDGEDTSAKTVQWTIGRATVAAIPTQSGSLTYDGGSKTPTWDGYDSAKLTLGGTTSGANAGSYNATFTPTKNYQWFDGSTAAKDAAWSIGRATVATAPTQSGSLTYTGSVLTPQWSNYDPAKLTLGGESSGVNAGSYNATFTPTGNYQWSGGGTGPQTVQWTIGKAAGSLSLNPQTLTLNSATKSGTITAVRAGDGTVTAESNATGVASVSVSGNTVTVTGKSYGTAVITVHVAAGTNYTAPAPKTCNVTVNVFDDSLSANTWAAIRAASDANEAANVWSVGDTKPINLNGTVGTLALSNLQVDAFIVGFNHNASREGSNRIHWAIGKISGTQVALCDSNYNSGYTDGRKAFNTNHWGNYNYGGWKGCDARYDILGSTNKQPSGYGSSPSSGRVGYDPQSYDIVNSPVANTLMAALPKDLRQVMKSVTKFTDNVAGGTGDVAGNVSSSVDYLFRFAEKEIYGGSRTYANSYEGGYQEQYQYFKAGNNKQLYRHDSRGTAVWAPLRSPYYYYSTTFSAVGAGAGGGVAGYSAHTCGGLFAGFTV